MKISPSWWLTDTYEGTEAIPPAITVTAGPNGVALVRVMSNGSTSKGWGLQGRDGEPGFMPRYLRNEFAERRVLYGYERGEWPFAFVMRSLDLIVIDIDGKNGGIEHANELLGNSTPTLCEQSKSGNGYHLFYRTNDQWDQNTGFGQYGDAIGVVQGVDIRATGCVYHYEQQRWNTRKIAPLPKHIAEQLRRKQERRAAQNAASRKITTLDTMEMLMAHEELITELNKGIPAGKRNITLFAIGSQLKEAEVPNWENLLTERGLDSGLELEEMEKLVRNVNAYVV